MSNWGKIPYVILRVVLLQLESTKEFHHCLFVNKYWFAACQPILYRQITIQNLHEDDNLINTLLHSKYEYGQVAKRVTFNEQLQVRDKNFKHLDSSKDPLHQLMIHCPQVEEFNFQKYTRIYSNGGFEYLLFVLKMANTWKLRIISEPDYPTNDINRYNRLVDLMFISLAKITVEKWSETKNDYNYLSIYPNLSSVRIKYHGPEKITDCVNLIKNVSLMSSLEINFDVSNETQISDVDDDEIMDVECFSGIKKLHVANLVPLRDKELLFIQDKFTEIVDLSIHQYSWGVKQSGSPALLDFIKYVRTIPKYSISITLPENNFEFLKQCLEIFGCNTFKLIFNGAGLEETFEAKLSNDVLSLIVSCYDHLQHIRRALDYIGQYLQNISIEFDDEVCNKYQNLIFTLCPRLRRLQFSQGVLRPIPQKITANNNLPHLVLRGVKLSDDFLLNLSSKLPYLEIMKLDKCHSSAYTKVIIHLTNVRNNNHIGNNSSRDSSSDNSRDSSSDGEHNDNGQ